MARTAQRCRRCVKIRVKSPFKLLIAIIGWFPTAYVETVGRPEYRPRSIYSLRKSMPDPDRAALHVRMLDAMVAMVTVLTLASRL